MSFHYYVDTHINCVFIRHINAFVIGDGSASIEVVLADADHWLGMNILRDLTQVSFSKEIAERSFSAQVCHSARAYEQQLGHCMIAWVLGSAAGFAVGHWWSASARPTRTFSRRPFRAVGPARAWLGIPEDDVIKYPDDD
jgi:hypothetical protein